MLPQIHSLTIHQSLPYSVPNFPRLSMNGHIRCSKCDKAMNKDVCPHCGSAICYISLYWKGKHYKFRRYGLDASLLYYRTAERQLTNIRSEIDSKTFNPLVWTDTGIKGRRFSTKLDEWLESKEEELKAIQGAVSNVNQAKTILGDATNNAYRAQLQVIAMEEALQAEQKKLEEAYGAITVDLNTGEYEEVVQEAEEVTE